MVMLFQCDIIASAMFLTGQASNPLMAKFALTAGAVEISYFKWMLGAIVPGILSMALIPWLLYRLFPPEVTYTPEAPAAADAELRRTGPMSGREWRTAGVFLLVGGLWMTAPLHHLNYTLVAIVGVCALFLSGALAWDDIVGEHIAWDVFIWFGGLVRMAEGLMEGGVTGRLADLATSFSHGWPRWAMLASLLLVFVYAHYGFATITSHATALFTPFLLAVLAGGAPKVLAILAFAYFANLSACLTHYGTTPAAIFFGGGYVTQREWWKYGFICSLVYLMLWATTGFAWWKALGWW
jgi:DASS family divalent anion:Na+ symporter